MRTSQLLRQAADALEGGEDPFGAPFLRHNDVTSDQCLTMAEQLAIGARMVAKAIDNPKSPLAQHYYMVMANL